MKISTRLPMTRWLAASFCWLSLVGNSAAVPMAGNMIVASGQVEVHRPRLKRSRTVSDYARLELGDIIRVGTDTSADLALFDSQAMALMAGTEYEVRRGGIYRKATTGDLRLHQFSVPLGNTASARQIDGKAGGVGTLQPSGETWVRRGGERRWREVHSSLELQYHDWVRTGRNGRAVVTVGDNGVVLLEEDSEAQLQSRAVVLEEGGVTVNCLRRSHNFEVHTPGVEASVKGGIMRVNAEDGEGVRVGVFSGRGVARERVGRKSQGLSPGSLARYDAQGKNRGAARIGNGRSAGQWAKEIRVGLRKVPRGLVERKRYLAGMFSTLHNLDDPRSPLPRTVRLKAVLAEEQGLSPSPELDPETGPAIARMPQERGSRRGS